MLNYLPFRHVAPAIQYVQQPVFAGAGFFAPAKARDVRKLG